MAASRSPNKRAISGVLGGFVADAATMPLHWIYDQAKMDSLVGTKPDPEFYDTPSAPFYTYERGELSPYGDEVLPLLRHVASRGDFDPTEFGDVSYEAAKSYSGRLNKVFKNLVEKGDAGHKYPHLSSPSQDAHGAIKTPMLVAKYFGDTEQLVAKTREATRVHQEGQEAEDAAVAVALLLQQVVIGRPVVDAIKTLASDSHLTSDTKTLVEGVIRDVEEKTYPDASKAVATYGKACGLPGVLQGMLYILLSSKDYVEGVRTNILAGGDNCSRSIVIGACLAAADTSDDGGIPAEWKAQTNKFETIESLALQLA